MKKTFLKTLATLFAVAAISIVPCAAAPVQSAPMGPAASIMMKTQYEREQQQLPLSQRDNLVAEPGFLALAIVLSIYIFFKLRRDMRKSDAEDKEYRRMIEEAERVEREEAEAEEKRKKNELYAAEGTATEAEEAAQAAALEAPAETVEAEIVGVEEDMVFDQESAEEKI